MEEAGFMGWYGESDRLIGVGSEEVDEAVELCTILARPIETRSEEMEEACFMDCR